MEGLETNEFDTCVLSNDEDNWSVRCLFMICSGVVGEEIDFERWIDVVVVLLGDDGDFE